MKKRLLCLCFFIATRAIEASWVGNPSDPAILEEGFWISDRCFSSVRAGISSDILFQKRLTPSHSSKDLGISHPEVSWTLAALDAGVNFKERLDLHLIAGPITAFHFHWKADGIDYRGQGEKGVFLGGSSKLIIMEIHDTTLGVDFHGGVFNSVKGTLTRNSVPSPHDFYSRSKFWQLSLGVSQTVRSLRPYVGGMVNRFSSFLKDHPMKRIDFRHLVRIGLFEGCTFSAGSKIFLNLEARQFSETGVSVTGEFRF